MTIGDGHDLQSPRFALDDVLEQCFDSELRMLAPESGPSVGKVQRALVDLGFLASYREDDQQFGARTGAAVSAFKVARGLTPADPVVGPGTIGALDSLFPVRPFATGAFAQFVTANRVDEDIADLLNELDAMPDAWAKQTAAFAFHELEVGNLVGIVRKANSSKIEPFIPVSFHPKLHQLAVGSFNAASEPVEVNPGQFLGYILVDDVFLNETHPGHNEHGFGKLVLAHELTHFRNRDFFVALDRSAVAANPGLFVDQALAGSLVDTQRIASGYMQELMCDHVAWRVKKGLDLRQGHTQPNLAAGQLYRFALDLAAGANDNGYITGLSAADRNRQVASWMRAAGDRLFHDDPARNAEVKTVFEAEFSAAQPGFATPTVRAAGGE